MCACVCVCVWKRRCRSSEKEILPILERERLNETAGTVAPPVFARVSVKAFLYGRPIQEEFGWIGLFFRGFHTFLPRIQFLS